MDSVGTKPTVRNPVHSLCNLHALYSWMVKPGGEDCLGSGHWTKEIQSLGHLDHGLDSRNRILVGHSCQPQRLQDVILGEGYKNKARCSELQDLGPQPLLPKSKVVQTK